MKVVFNQGRSTGSMAEVMADMANQACRFVLVLKQMIFLSMSRNSGSPGSAGSAPPLPGARSSRSGPRESSVSSSHHVRSKLSQSGRTTQLTGKTANLDGFVLL